MGFDRIDEVCFMECRACDIWVYARDQRPWGGPSPPTAVYLFAPDRKAERPVAHLAHFHGRWTSPQPSRRTTAVGLETGDSCQDLTDVQAPDAYTRSEG
jgi:hypothetical protein